MTIYRKAPPWFGASKKVWVDSFNIDGEKEEKIFKRGEIAIGSFALLLQHLLYAVNWFP